MTGSIVNLAKCNVMIEMDNGDLKFGIVDQKADHIEWYAVNQNKMTIEKIKGEQ